MELNIFCSAQCKISNIPQTVFTLRLSWQFFPYRNVARVSHKVSFRAPAAARKGRAEPSWPKVSKVTQKLPKGQPNGTNKWYETTRQCQPGGALRVTLLRLHLGCPERKRYPKRSSDLSKVIGNYHFSDLGRVIPRGTPWEPREGA